MSACPSVDRLNHWLDDALSAAERTEVSHHVDHCPACQRSLDQLTAAPEEILEPPINSADAPDADLSRLFARMRTPSIEPASSTPIGTSPDSDVRAPLTLADYDLLECLGEGGMGKVFRAIQRSLNKPVAVKVLDAATLPGPRHQRADDELVARFIHEARAAALLRHPHIVDVHGLGRTPEGGYFLVMDLVEGMSLEQQVRGRHTLGTADVSGPILPLDSDWIAQVVAKIADAIDHAHQLGVIHRDLKPGNILLSHAGEVFVTDFGVAKVLGSDTSPLSRNCLAIGTPHYMAPEQADPRRGSVGPSTDVYGLGGILYFLLTGQHPYQAGEAGDLSVVGQVLADEMPLPPSVLCPTVSPALERICLRCLCKRPEERFATARELAEALRQSIDGVESDGAVDRRGSPSYGVVEVAPPLGAVALDSPYYVVRAADVEYHAALRRSDSIVLVRGARQIGKTSLMARGLQQARRAGMQVALTDCQKLNAADLESAEHLYLALAEWIADALELNRSLHDTWNSRHSANVNFERFLRREVLASVTSPLVWGLDEVDRLFTCSFSSEVFGLFRSWHNERALDPTGPWSRLTLSLAYATEAHLFITDINQSPFNVGTRIALADFSPAEIRRLNDQYRSPLQTDADFDAFIDLAGGQPYLVHRGLYEMAHRGWSPREFCQDAERDDGVFGDHLRRILVLLDQDFACGYGSNQGLPLRQSLRDLIIRQQPPAVDHFYRLRSAGLVVGESAAQCQPRCGLYRRFLERRLA